MGNIAIRVEELGKQYRIGTKTERYKSVRESLSNSFISSLRKLNQSLQGQSEIISDNSKNIWALKDVSFKINHGEVVGIIGRNGAGKSTLLKILSRITEPTTGYAEINGRVGSLLEVGTGFHPELTGRENIYLNGAILGMKREEINNKFDEIVAFSEFEKFIETPVKYYSSGMEVRLAFAVAAHLEPEILIVDEVLAVGDAAFQKKCLGKIGEVSKEGRTVLLVSHNMGMVQTLCNRAVLLRHGTLFADNTAAAAVTAYLGTLEETASQDLLDRVERRGKGQIRLAQIEICTCGDSPSTTLATGRSARLIFHTTALRSGMSCSFTIYDQYGQPVTYFDSAVHGQEDLVNPDQGAKFLCEIDELVLIPGRYRINAAITCDGELQDHIEAAAFLEVEEGELRGRPVPRHAGHGSIFMRHRWITPDSN